MRPTAFDGTSKAFSVSDTAVNHPKCLSISPRRGEMVDKTNEDAFVFVAKSDDTSLDAFRIMPGGHLRREVRSTYWERQSVQVKRRMGAQHSLRLRGLVARAARMMVIIH